jgi:hypothetical protein
MEEKQRFTAAQYLEFWRQQGLEPFGLARVQQRGLTINWWRFPMYGPVPDWWPFDTTKETA